MTFSRAGIFSSTSVTSSPSFDKCVPPQPGQISPAGWTISSRGRCSGNGRRTGWRRSRSGGRYRNRALARRVPLRLPPGLPAAVPAAAICASSFSDERPNLHPAQLVQLRLVLLDQQMRAGQFRPRRGQFGLAFGELGTQLGDLSGGIASCRQILPETRCRNARYPADCPSHFVARIQQAASGVQVRTGARQSIPSSSIESCAAVSKTEPSLACGQMNLPRSSRLQNRQDLAHPTRES